MHLSLDIHYVIMKYNKLYIIAAFVLVFGILFLMNNTTNVDEEILAEYESLPPQAKSLYYQQSESLTKPVPQRLVELDRLTIGCFGPDTIIQMPISDTNLGGQCCGALHDVEDYEEQLKALRSFIKENGNIDLIPKDPYEISIEDAQQLIKYDSIILTPSQQKTYDDAMQMSHHGGPCCCKCWKWYMMSGLGKTLIIDYDFDSEQLAELWDSSSSCGHAEDTNMRQHYE